MSAVYFARCGDYVKIGFASNPTHRAQHLFNGVIAVPDDLDQTLPVEIVLVVPFCRMRDERNLQLLFANHWVVGEWYRWSTAFEYQMRTMTFVTDAVRRKYLRGACRALGLDVGPHKETRWGKQTQELLADLREMRAAA